MVPLLERKLSLSILNISILLKTNYNKQRAINGYKAVIPYGLLEERGTDVCTDNNIRILYIYISQETCHQFTLRYALCADF